MSKKSIIDFLREYLQAIGWEINNRGKITQLKCPLCQKEPMSACIIPNSSMIKCHSCFRTYNLKDIVKSLHKEIIYDIDIDNHIKDTLKIDFVTETDIKKKLEEHLKYYNSLGFDLVPIAKNQKIPIEKEWQNKEHKNIEEWYKWLDDGINIGVKTGKRSNITVIDIDQKEIPDELKRLLTPTIVQETARGWHYIYLYEELPTTRIDDLKVDLLNDGKQFVIYPSIVNDEQRKLDIVTPISKMSKELIEYLKSKVTLPSLKTFSEKIKEDIVTGDLSNIDIQNVNEGNRTNILLRTGGILRKELNLSQTGYALNLINNLLCKPPLPSNELNNIVKSLDKYSTFDLQELALKILNYLRIVEEANSRDVKEALGEPKESIERALAYLSKEGFIIKKRRYYNIIKKADWKEIFPNIDNSINFKLPYFQEVANYQWGDLILLGSKAKFGKTTIAMNLINDFVNQGIKPYYICLETGSRFIKTAVQLGMKEGDFYFDFVSDPAHIELEKNAVTIIDWLCLQDFATTDKVFLHFIEQLYKTQGFLIVFMQLKEDGSWFAPNLIKHFPSLAARYLYDNEEDGTYGKWIVDVIREAKDKVKRSIIPCQYIWESRKLVTLEELDKMGRTPSLGEEDVI